MAATLTKEMLQDLKKGKTKIKVVSQTYNITDTTFDDADEFYTLEDSLVIEQASPTISGIKVDQLDGSVAETTEFADTTIAGSIPSSAKEVFDFFYEKSTTQPTLTTGITSHNGTKLTKGDGYNMNPKPKNLTVLLESESGDTAIVFTNVTLFGGISISSVKTTPWSIPFSGTAKEALEEGKPSFIVLRAV